MTRTLSILIPVYDESAYITRCLYNVINTHIPSWEMEIIAVDDGSTDGSLQLLKDFQKKHPIQVLSQPHNMGKGAALKEAMKHAKGDVLIVQDADLEYDPQDYQQILDLYEKPEVEVVFGSRVLGNNTYHSSLFFYLGGLSLTMIMNLLFGTKLTDQPTCYKSWRASLSEDILSSCPGNGFDFEIEMTAYFARKTRIHEVPIHYYPRKASHGKKVTYKDGLKCIQAALKTRLKQPSSEGVQ